MVWKISFEDMAEEVAILEIAPTIHETGEIATRRSLLQGILFIKNLSVIR